MNNVKYIKELVETIISRDEKARNNDTWLILEVLRELGFKVHIKEKDIRNMPSFETITRCRRLFQEKNKYSARDNIKKYREIKEEHYKTMFTNSHLS